VVAEIDAPVASALERSVVCHQMDATASLRASSFARA